jgi:outer membrane lipoprotein-sorting protein
MQSEGEFKPPFRTESSAGGVCLFLMVLLVATSSCLVKRTVKVPVSSRVLAAKEATVDELLASLTIYSQRIQSLSSGTLKVSLTSGRPESGKLLAYHSAPGWIVLKRPDFIRLNIQNPVTKTSLFELVSAGDPFSFWYPRENKLYLGKNSMREIEVEGQPLTLRPIHILQAILPERLDLNEPDSYLVSEEDRDATTKYYVLSLVKGEGGKIIHPRRRIWIDRSVLAVTRQELFDDRGRIISDITYAQLAPVGDMLLPFAIKIERPLDGYSLEMQIKDWRVNPELEPKAFEFAPPGAQRIELNEKGRSE